MKGVSLVASGSPGRPLEDSGRGREPQKVPGRGKGLGSQFAGKRLGV